MATTGDPWRTLGLTPGASLDEVRRAYRRLAKANHPDAAGEVALPRFLAIQAAYEAIAGPTRGRRVGGRPSEASPRPASPSEPWRADPDRARASGRADGRRPGARPTGRPAGTGSARGSASKPAEDASGGGADSAGRAGSAGPGERTRSGSAGRSRRSSSRRAPKTAGPYSTSYDAADEEPFEPGWSGATWYGASSGTYWTINPKEYADPRKHGPEYQARARRAHGAGGWILDDAAEPGAEAPERGPAAEPEPRDEPPADEAAAEPPPSRPAPGPRPRSSAWSSSTRTSARPAGARGAGDLAGDVPPPARPPGPATSPADGGFRAPVLPVARSSGGRAATALLAWPPLALFVASAIGESTGCGRYAASCAEVSSPGTWILALAILILLVAAPTIARWSAHGTVAMLLLGVPSAVVLSAAGGTNVREASAPILLGVLAIAYLVGIAYALVGPRLGARGGAVPESGPPGSLR